MVARFLFVTGAPGAGKSAVAEALLDLEVEALVFDGDWLLDSASDLAGGPIMLARDLWPAYDRLWVTFMEIVTRNGHPAVLFTPMNPFALPDLPETERAAWCLLDCDDYTRRARLSARHWDSFEIEDALGDAEELRGQVETVVDTSEMTPSEAAARVADWIRAHIDSGGR